MPPKPLLETCVLAVPPDIISGHATCGYPDGKNFTTASDASYKNMVFQIKNAGASNFPLTYVDNAIALRPIFYYELIKYIGELEKKARKSCR